MKVETLRFARIDFSDERFRISPDSPDERLRDSLRRVGPVQPLLLVERSGRLVLLSGWKRTSELRAIGSEEAPACVVPEPDDLAAFRRVFFENAAIRDFSIIEKALICRRLIELGEEEKTVVSSVLPFFRLPPSRATLEALRTLSAEDPETLLLLHRSDVPPAGAVILAAMSPEARKRVATLLFPLGRNKQSELLDHLADLSVREGRPIVDILESEEIRPFLVDTSLGALDRSEKLREWLGRMKNPRVRAWTDAFGRAVRRLGLPGQASLRADPGFESEELVLTLSFRSAEEFRAGIRELDRISREKDLDALFEVPEDGPE